MPRHHIHLKQVRVPIYLSSKCKTHGMPIHIGHAQDALRSTVVQVLG